MTALIASFRLVSLSIFLLASKLTEAGAWQSPSPHHPTRKNVINTALKWLGVPSVLNFIPMDSPASAAVGIQSKYDKSKQDVDSYTVYQVLPDASEALAPSIIPIKVGHVIIS